jgi:glycosyltransferase involved in cell wall biosynthesis
MRSLVKASLANNDLRSLTDSKVARLHRLFLSQVDAYVAISTDLGREFLARGLEPKRIFAIPNGVDVERFRPADRAEKRALAESLGIPTNRPIGQAVRERCCWLSSFVWRIMRLHIDTVREILPGSVSAATF